MSSFRLTRIYIGSSIPTIQLSRFSPSLLGTTIFSSATRTFIVPPLRTIMSRGRSDISGPLYKRNASLNFSAIFPISYLQSCPLKLSWSLEVEDLLDRLSSTRSRQSPSNRVLASATTRLGYLQPLQTRTYGENGLRISSVLLLISSAGIMNRRGSCSTSTSLPMSFILLLLLAVFSQT